MFELFTVVILLALDQATKYFTNVMIPLNGSKDILSGIFAFSNVHNYGAAWGVLSGAKWFFIALTAFVLVFILFLFIKYRSVLSIQARMILVLLFSGAAGNLIDRIIYSYVRDMFDFYLINFPVFNIADCAVTVGAILLVIDTLFGNDDSLLSVIEKQFSFKGKNR